MKTRQLIITIGGALLLASTCIAQKSYEDYAQFLLSVNKNYQDAQSYSMTVSVQYFMDHQEGSQQQSCKTIKSGRQFYTTAFGVTSIITDKYFLVKDDHRMAIQIQAVNSEVMAQPQSQLPDLVLTANQLAADSVEVQETEKTISFTLENFSDFDQAIFTYDKVQKLFINIDYINKSQSPTNGMRKVSIQYNDVTINTPVPDQYFDIAQYFKSFDLDNMELADAYSQYQLINQLNPK